MGTTLRNTEVTAPLLQEITKARQLHTLSLLGSLDKKAFPGMYTFANTTYYEEITCVGYNPSLSRLEAVVDINQVTGYNGGLCMGGSTEYVRFFVDWGAGFQDIGLASFNAHDISTGVPDHPISYMVYINLDDSQHERLCSAPVVPVVRAILQWNTAPTANPNQHPFFGNVVDIHIQLSPSTKLIKLPEMAIAELVTLYQKQKIDIHRPIYPIVHAGLAGGKSTAILAKYPDLSHLNTLGTNLENVIASIVGNKQTGPKANVDFEELTCAGLNTNTDTLGAVIKIKKPSGYGGDLCHAGSSEFVAFWADWNNDGTFDQYLGTTSVALHDLNASFPKDDLYYCVALPVNLSAHLRDCKKPNVVRIRAVLSWGSLPSTTDPNALNYYGNRIDTHVQIRPGSVPGDKVEQIIYAVGGVDLNQIDYGALGLHLAYATGAVNAGSYRPFGGIINIQGSFLYTGAPGTIDYKVEYSSDGVNWYPVNDSLTNYIFFWEELSPMNPHPLHIISQNAKPGGWFSYLPSDAPHHTEENNMLASWPTHSLQGTYQLRMAFTTDTVNHTNVQYSEVIYINVFNTYFTKNKLPHAALDMSKTLDLVIVGGDCKTYKQKELISGKLRVQSTYFGSWYLEIQPAAHVHPTPTTIQPLSGRQVISLVDNGDGNYDWTIDTKDLDPCGYTLCLRGYDRTIVDSSSSYVHWDGLYVGFSVIA
jgi:hypothetical protein